jgi:hypothetical protein
MRKLALVAMVVGLGVAACDSGVTDLDGENSCAGINGFYTATSFTAVGTQNAQLTHNVLANGATFTINFLSGNFTSTFRLNPGSNPTQRQGAFALQNGTITMGNQTLFPGAAAGTQLFTCTASGKNLELIATSTSYMFPGETTAASARITIQLSKP